MGDKVREILGDVNDELREQLKSEMTLIRGDIASISGDIASVRGDVVAMAARSSLIKPDAALMVCTPEAASSPSDNLPSSVPDVLSRSPSENMSSSDTGVVSRSSA